MISMLADAPIPCAAPGEVVIAIMAAALNFFDILMIQGKYQIKPPFPVLAGRRSRRCDRERRRRRHRPEGRRSRGCIVRPQRRA